MDRVRCYRSLNLDLLGYDKGTWMQKILMFLSLMNLWSCSHLPLFKKATIEAKSSYKIEQVTFLSPGEANWSLMANDIHSLVFAKNYSDDEQTALISAMMYPVGLHKNSKVFLEFLASERTKADDKKRFKILSVTNQYVTFKQLPCLKYETLSEDHQNDGIDSKDFKYFKTSGYICRYPLEYIGFQFEVSHRSKSQEIPADLEKISQEFFENIQFVEGTIKRLKTIP